MHVLFIVSHYLQFNSKTEKKKNAAEPEVPNSKTEKKKKGKYQELSKQVIEVEGEHVEHLDMYNEEAIRIMKKYIVAGVKPFHSLKAVKSHLRERKEKQDSEEEGEEGASKKELFEEKVGERGSQDEDYENLKIRVMGQERV